LVGIDGHDFKSDGEDDCIGILNSLINVVIIVALTCDDDGEFGGETCLLGCGEQLRTILHLLRIECPLVHISKLLL
jgi:hypothetical protein